MAPNTRAGIERRSLYTRTTGTTDEGLDYRSVTMSDAQWKTLRRLLWAFVIFVGPALTAFFGWVAHTVVQHWVATEDAAIVQRMDDHDTWAKEQIEERRANTVTRREFDARLRYGDLRLARIEALLDALYVAQIGKPAPPHVIDDYKAPDDWPRPDEKNPKGN